jgi:glutamate dehydrogenase (NAD(P)+)
LGHSQNITIAIHGMGNVGSFFGSIAEAKKPEWKLTAATDSSGGVTNLDGLSAKDLNDFKQSGGKLIDFKIGQPISNDELIVQPVDILVLAALGDVVNAKNMNEVKAKIILELANGPVSETAHEYLTKKGVVIIPDIIANAGGVVVSYLEWMQNKKNEHWSRDRVNKELEEYLKKAVDDVFNEQSKYKEFSLKETALALAIRRILKAKGEAK